MSDPVTSLRPTVKVYGKARPWIGLLFTDLEKVKEALEAHQVKYEVGEDAYSFDEEPEIVIIQLGREADPEAIQKLLDGIA